MPSRETSNRDSFSRESSNRQLSAFRRQHIGRALFRSLSAFQARFADAIRARGFEDFRRTDVEIIARVPVEGGARVTDIAARSPVSKQAIGKLVRGLEERGYVSRSPDPNDGRAALVELSPRGRALLEAGQEVVQEIERDWSARLGEARFEQLRADLLTLSDTFGEPETL